MPIPDLNQPPERDPLKVLLALLVDKVGLGHRPPLDHAGQRDRSKRGQPQKVRRAQRKVGKELQVARRVRPQLQVARRHAVLGLAPQRLQEQRLERARQPRRGRVVGLRLGGSGFGGGGFGGSGFGTASGMLVSSLVIEPQEFGISKAGCSGALGSGGQEEG